jgi:hypothetical protein
MTMVSPFRKGNSDPRLPQTNPPAPPPSMVQPRELHPAAKAAAAQYSAVWEENDILRAENQRLKNEIDVARNLDIEKTAMLSDMRARLDEAGRSADDRVAKVELHYRDRLAEAERAKERYLRYAVGIGERIKGCLEQLAGAHAHAMDMADSTPIDAAVHKIDAAMKEMVAALPREADGR